MKKKIYSLIMGICLFFVGVFSFSGCSLVSGSSEKKGEAIVMKIGDTNVTKNDLINAFYTYYQNNSSYFAYYDEATIEESFYTWFTVKTLVTELSYKALYDETTNPSGYIYYTSEDAETVWEYVEDYFYSQVNTYEKALLSADGVLESDYPEWLHDHADDAETETGFSYYTSPVKDIVYKDRKADAVKKLTEEQVYSKVDALKTGLFKYVESEDEDGNETLADIMDEGLIVRNQAYANYIQALVSNAKANGKSTDVNDVLKAEVLRIYNAYYESQVSVIFQNFYVQDYLLDLDGTGDKATLNDKAVVAKFLDAYYADRQTYRLQDGYVEKMESQDGASLLLYHYEGRSYYFSVQHILVQFTDYVMEQVQNLEGYGVSNSGEVITDKYVEDRNQIAVNAANAILTKVNKDAEKGTIVPFGSYYYYDETKKESETDNYGYIKLSTGVWNSVTKKVDQTNPQTYTNSEGKEITWESDEAVMMATKEDIVEAYSYNYDIWKGKVEELLNDATKSIDDVIGENVEEGRYEELRYVLEVAQNMKLAGVANEEIFNKVASLLFVELQWVYSSDSLGNEISNKIGYIVSSQEDNNMNWVVDFAVGARELLAYMKTEGFANKTSDEKAIYTEAYLTDYGWHIMKIENVYDKAHSSIVDLSSVVADFDLTAGSDYVEEVTALLKKTYVCNSSNETLYNHYYDEVYNNLVGTSSSSGTYFLALEYDWLSQYYSDEKVEIIKKVEYNELLESIS